MWTSDDTKRAALAVMPIRTPNVHAAREHASTIGLCRAADARVPGAGSLPAPTTATAAPRRRGGRLGSGTGARTAGHERTRFACPKVYRTGLMFSRKYRRENNSRFQL